MKNKLTAKEQQFCFYFSITRSPREAAEKAGVKFFPERYAMKLLARQDIADEIGRVSRRLNFRDEAAAGLRRIAFGKITDAVRLMMDEKAGENLSELDLFNVSEMKISKNGVMELKFFDRVKALEKLTAIAKCEQSSEALPFYEALEKGAINISKIVGDADD